MKQLRVLMAAPDETRQLRSTTGQTYDTQQRLGADERFVVTQLILDTELTVR
jgi:hypothetical protein